MTILPLTFTPPCLARRNTVFNIGVDNALDTIDREFSYAASLPNRS